MGEFRVLLVDDDPDGLAALKQFVSLHVPQAVVLTASNGAEALAWIPRFMPQLVLSDHQMPAMDGTSMLRKARTILPDAVLVLLTGYADQWGKIAASDPHAVDAFFLKPIETAPFAGWLKALSDTMSRQDPVNAPR